MVWIPGHIVTYGVMPPAFRLPWMSFLSFGYVGLLSVTRGTMEAPPKDDQKKVPGAPTQVGLTRRLSNAVTVCEDKALLPLSEEPRRLTQAEAHAAASRARAFVKHVSK